MYCSRKGYRARVGSNLQDGCNRRSIIHACCPSPTGAMAAVSPTLVAVLVIGVGALVLGILIGT